MRTNELRGASSWHASQCAVDWMLSVSSSSKEIVTSGIALGCKTSQPGTATGLRHDASLVRVLHTLTNDANENAKQKDKILSQNGLSQNGYGGFIWHFFHCCSQSFIVDSNLLHPTKVWTEHFHASHFSPTCMHSLKCRTWHWLKVSLAHISHANRPCTLHSSPFLSHLLFHSLVLHLPSSMWVGLRISPIRISANEELGASAENNLHTDLDDFKSASGGTMCIFEVARFFLANRFVRNEHQSQYQEWGDPYTNLVRVNPNKLPTQKKIHGMVDDLDNFDFDKRAFFSWGSFVVYLWRQRNSDLWRQRNSDQDGREGKKPYNETCSLNPKSFSWVVDRIIWTPRINSRTYSPWETSHVINGIIFCVCSTSDFLSSVKCSEVMSQRTQEDAGEETDTAKLKPMLNLVSRCSVRGSMCLRWLHQKVMGKPNLNVKTYLWLRWLCSNQERGHPAHQTTQNGILTKSVLLKSSPSTRTMTMIWILTPSQKQTCR